MKLYILGLLLAVVVATECGHTFMGTNVMRRQAHHAKAKFAANTFSKRIEYVSYTIPNSHNQSIQGILAYDLTNSGASANVTSGGLGFNHVTLRLKSDRGKRLQYDIYIYV
ncbi:uncharacterized protein LOC115440892 [Manduca sexta]|uniref:Salivary secreted peptide n=1 Tax=Manduca sexta TaxID=7130 RepID=A0A921YUY4_MANSE|nr:uncharacterized protein LOC115440892 [Manduca sexta]KAG6446067.1 hypothetical protein O3G_MSEX004263 [Manduca sexta]